MIKEEIQAGIELQEGMRAEIVRLREQRDGLLKLAKDLQAGMGLSVLGFSVRGRRLLAEASDLIAKCEGGAQ